eukprot:TRINITY_DN16332_c0_g1_i2.p1 TRINITY_DN16332_c0_g1~~TRINITY_DN16332_c0_g1_i2.p1  ORF type:complete len:198 (-),score=87.00 TRINITY_DN16332_c0_g1_i2:24-617(-)
MQMAARHALCLPLLLIAAPHALAVSSAGLQQSTKQSESQQQQASLAAEQEAARQGTLACLNRVASLPKAQGYGALCTSVESLYFKQLELQKNYASLLQENKAMKDDVKKKEPLIAQRKAKVLLEQKQERAGFKQQLHQVQGENEELRAEVKRLKAEAEAARKAAAAEKEGRGQDVKSFEQQLKAVQAENADLVARCA